MLSTSGRDEVSHICSDTTHGHELERTVLLLELHDLLRGCCELGRVLFEIVTRCAPQLFKLIAHLTIQRVGYDFVGRRTPTVRPVGIGVVFWLTRHERLFCDVVFGAVLSTI